METFSIRLKSWAKTRRLDRKGNYRHPNVVMPSSPSAWAAGHPPNRKYSARQVEQKTKVDRNLVADRLRLAVWARPGDQWAAPVGSEVTSAMSAPASASSARAPSGALVSRTKRLVKWLAATALAQISRP